MQGVQPGGSGERAGWLRGLLLLLPMLLLLLL